MLVARSLLLASLVMTKGYLVAAEAVPDIALATGFTDWPAATLPVFIAMMFGATLGGNATLVGAAGNIVAAGIAHETNRASTFQATLTGGRTSGPRNPEQA